MDLKHRRAYAFASAFAAFVGHIWNPELKFRKLPYITSAFFTMDLKIQMAILLSSPLQGDWRNITVKESAYQNLKHDLDNISTRTLSALKHEFGKPPLNKEQIQNFYYRFFCFCCKASILGAEYQTCDLKFAIAVSGNRIYETLEDLMKQGYIDDLFWTAIPGWTYQKYLEARKQFLIKI